MTDGNVLTCKLCHVHVGSTKKSIIEQHILTQKHSTHIENINAPDPNSTNTTLSYIEDSVNPLQSKF